MSSRMLLSLVLQGHLSVVFACANAFAEASDAEVLPFLTSALSLLIESSNPGIGALDREARPLIDLAIESINEVGLADEIPWFAKL